jgi:hypothetical protein
VKIEMLGLPKATEMSKQLPKKAFYTKFQMNTAAKAKIDADISRITIVNEIAPNKVNISAGEDVKNFFVLLSTCRKQLVVSEALNYTSNFHSIATQSNLFFLHHQNIKFRQRSPRS